MSDLQAADYTCNSLGTCLEGQCMCWLQGVLTVSCRLGSRFGCLQAMIDQQTPPLPTCTHQPCNQVSASTVLYSLATHAAL